MGLAGREGLPLVYVTEAAVRPRLPPRTALGVAAVLIYSADIGIFIPEFFWVPTDSAVLQFFRY